MTSSEGDGSDRYGERYPHSPDYPQPHPQGYPQQPYNQGHPQGYGFGGPPRTNTLAVASVVLALAGLTLLPFAGSIAAVVCGHIARGQIRRTGEAGAGLSVVGWVIGYVTIVLGLAMIALFLVFAWRVSAQ